MKGVSSGTFNRGWFLYLFELRGLDLYSTLEIVSYTFMDLGSNPECYKDHILRDTVIFRMNSNVKKFEWAWCCDSIFNLSGVTRKDIVPPIAQQFQ